MTRDCLMSFIMQNGDILWWNYENEPIGKPNPYYRCIGCKKSDPEINGQLKNHGFGCSEVEKYLLTKQES